MPRTWLVTGSSRGIGRAPAKAIIASGDQFVATARNPDDLVELVTMRQGRLIASQLDVTNESAAARAVAVAVKQFGSLDIAVTPS